ncbi:c-type cytochrome [Curvibacter sp. APW13]|uniref:c-type cytochrome n=1 Tax=Curvibacter sp. APW13 TaxID=3077236 RepID=UPI0028DD958A|nr:c-type cytochrome [Curvibacter sp. APW13]MDT8989473.1 c-type cytochrome [Curvibacter sp. APW13]
MQRFTVLALVALLCGPSWALDIAAPDIVAMRCGACHGPQGQATSPIYPSLAGQNPQYIAKQLSDFVAGRRVNETMSPQAQDLSPQNIAELAAFFAAKPPRIGRVSNADSVAHGQALYTQGKAASGIPACASCHGLDAHGTATLPRLAGQNARYLSTQLQDFTLRRRTNDNAVMHDIAAKLSPEDTKALSDYLTQLP